MELIPRRSGGARRPTMRQVVVVMPSAFTLGNLFFGFWSIVSAFNGNFRWAGWFIVFSGLLDIRHGGVVYNGTRGFLNFYGMSKESERRGVIVEETPSNKKLEGTVD